MSLINREALYEKACDLEAQALAYVGKIANDETKIEEWKIWSAILVERTAFKHDIFDAPSVQPEVLACGSGELNVQSEPHWIPVTERLPEPRIDVWVNSDIGQIQGYYEENVKIWYASFGQGRDYLELIVNAWMPLPEPWKEGGEE